jgi:hypothetical protein
MQQTARGALHLVVILARVCFALVAWLRAALVVTQVFLAGLSIFAGAQNWSIHEGLGWALQLPMLALLVLAPIARLPWRTMGLTLLLLLLYLAQVLLVIVPRQVGAPAVSALHPVNALLIFGVALALARQAFQFFPRSFALARA